MAWVTSSFCFYTRPCVAVSFNFLVDPFGKEGHFLWNFIPHPGGVGSNHYWIFLSCLPHDSNPPEVSLWDTSLRDSWLKPLSNEACSAPISLPFFAPFSPRLWVDQEIRDSLQKTCQTANRPILWFEGFFCNLQQCVVPNWFIDSPTSWRIRSHGTSNSQIDKQLPKSPPVCWSTYSAAADDEGYWSPPSRYRGRCLTRRFRKISFSSRTSTEYMLAPQS